MRPSLSDVTVEINEDKDDSSQTIMSTESDEWKFQENETCGTAMDQTHVHDSATEDEPPVDIKCPIDCHQTTAWLHLVCENHLTYGIKLRLLERKRERLNVKDTGKSTVCDADPPMDHPRSPNNHHYHPQYIYDITVLEALHGVVFLESPAKYSSICA